MVPIVAGYIQHFIPPAQRKLLAGYNSCIAVLLVQLLYLSWSRQFTFNVRDFLYIYIYKGDDMQNVKEARTSQLGWHSKSSSSSAA